jgi:hypothetical protein
MSSNNDIPPDRDTSGILTPTLDSQSTKLDKDLKIWYAGLSPRYVDLVSDFAGQEFFLLDGEALMQRVFNDRMLDLAGSAGGMHPSHSLLSLCSHQDSKCCTASTWWNDSSLT